MWLDKLIVKAFIEEKIWEKHRVRRHEIEEVLAHRQAIRLRHKQNPVRVVIIGATQARRLLKIILQFHGRGRYFLVTAMDLTAKERKQYGKKLRAIPKFVSWEQEDEFWSTHDLTDLDLEEDSTPLVIERSALRHVKKIEVANPMSIRPWKRKTA